MKIGGLIRNCYCSLRVHDKDLSHQKKKKEHHAYKRHWKTYIPGRGLWAINKAHGLGRWPPLHLGGAPA
ncbi:hypothetical protein RGQ29_014345 [Quercus rubra]|uniref:Uncharacterized protein n=1 Tax=Quercus rubra TaxID=3512 RepID=A0AAN7FM67_QUERU|nr:hypothetical protein RGQ29_014345 [Quercus rubra]